MFLWNVDQNDIFYHVTSY